MEHPNNLDAVFKESIEDQMLRELFYWKHSHASEKCASILSCSAHFGLGCEKLEGFFGGRVESETHFQVLMGSQVLGLVIKIPVRRWPDEDAAFHPATLAGLCFSRSSLRFCVQ